MESPEVSNGNGFDADAYWDNIIVMGLRSGEKFQAISEFEVISGSEARSFGGKAALRIGEPDYDALQEWLETSYQIHLPLDFPAEHRNHLQALLDPINAKLRKFRSELGKEGAPIAELADWFSFVGHERCSRKLRRLQKIYYTHWRIPGEVNLDDSPFHMGMLGFLPSDQDV